MQKVEKIWVKLVEINVVYTLLERKSAGVILENLREL